ncbi:uncharacterized protein G2W53_019531 [Senna tora]|uniref:Uncharacterized protein n=1 Tax=Senna tora TaxID=362788 RepID=A0A834WME8_9FABA|nr:uncharacterized protein G2W53_019531 [Senna tora]
MVQDVDGNRYNEPIGDGGGWLEGEGVTSSVG